MSRTTFLTAAVFLLALALVVVFVTRPSAPVVSRTAPVAAPVVPASPDAADAAPAKDSTDPVVTGFLSSFKSSSVAACRTSLAATLHSTKPGVADNVSAVCDCASDRVAASLTVGEVHAAALSAVNGDTSSNPTIQAMRSRFSDAAKQCMLDRQAH